MQDISDKLVKLRKHKKITQEQLASSLHVSRKTISNWENKRGIPDLDSLNLICNIFNIPLTYFSEKVEDCYIDNNSTIGKKSFNNTKTEIMKYTFYFNLILTVVSAVNLFIIGKYHLTFITPLLILNLCVFFSYYGGISKNFKLNRKKII
ncbi:helix-turn-helix domain-containing protein, partial [Fructilactobacillus florum]|uniref:helix-turn-helix domain-containing protein n=2 Tax=Fructilactobacillus florum TaxID=640331 RepID=UPI000686351E